MLVMPKKAGFIMIPKTLEEWTLDTISQLVVGGYKEAELFDFKASLPDKSDREHKLDLLKDCCAFANSSGGFLVFGVSDDLSGPVEKRLKGISTKEFLTDFGNYPSQCTPSVKWDYKNPPIPLENGNSIYAIEIFKSWDAPHCFENRSNVSNQWYCFPKRTNKGNEYMSYEEIRMSFLQYYEKRLKLQLLRAELETIKNTADALTRQGESVASPPPLGEFSLTILETTLEDTYTILMSNVLFLSHLTTIRRLCRLVNNKLQSILPVYYMPMTDKKTIFIDHNSTVTSYCQAISSMIPNMLQTLDGIISE
jgi:hypothetical protein